MLNWIQSHIPVWVVIAAVAPAVVLGAVAYLILLERKTASWVQDRIGPNRTSLGFGIIPYLKDIKMFGLGQPMADGLKFFLKEDYMPKGVDKILFTVAPAIMIMTVMISIAVLPWGGTRRTSREITVPASVEPVAYAQTQLANGSTLVPGGVQPTGRNDGTYDVTYEYAFQIANLNVGVLYVLVTLSLAVYGVVIGGWASNNKYSFLGGLRATANMISYEIPLGLSVLCIVLMYGTLDLGSIVEGQAHYWLGVIPAWNVFTQPLAFTMFLICIHAEANRAPFDLAEAEQELVGGYHTEYSSMRFALFFLAEYAGMITTSAVCVALFFGGWHLPWIEWLPPFAHNRPDALHPAVTTSLLINLIRAAVFFGKTMGVIFIFMWVRWSLPRFRFDQLMMLAWRGLIPIALVLLMATAIVVAMFHGQSARPQGVGVRMAAVFFLVNAAAGVLIPLASLYLPAAPATNRRMAVPDSRFTPRGRLAAAGESSVPLN